MLIKKFICSRTAINNASGVRSPMGGVTTGVLILICLAFFMPYCAFIPKVVGSDADP